jgi:hypothetical protein
MKWHGPMVLGLVLATVPAPAVDAAAIFVDGNTTITVSDEGLASASAAEAAFLAGLGSFTTESFDGFPVGTRADMIVTPVGDFLQLLAGSGGECENLSCDGLLVDSLAFMPPAYVGRFPIDGEQWLDSNDSMESRWLRTGSAPTSLGFYITDPNDQGARIDVSGFDALEESFLFGDLFGPLTNGAVFYITLTDPDGLDFFNFIQTDPADGFGIDRFTIGEPSDTVPEPATLGLVGLALLGLYASRRPRNRA